MADFDDRIPRKTDHGVGAAFTAGISGLHHCHGLCRTVGIFRSGTDAITFVVRLAKFSGLLVPACSFNRRCSDDALSRAISICLSAGQNSISSTTCDFNGSQQDAGKKQQKQFFTCFSTTGTSGDCSWSQFGHDGNTRGFWHNAVVCSTNFHHRNLSHLVWCL